MSGGPESSFTACICYSEPEKMATAEGGSISAGSMREKKRGDPSGLPLVFGLGEKLRQFLP